MLEFASLAQTVGTHLGTLAVGVIGTVALFLKKYKPLIERGTVAAEKAFEHLQKNLPAIETAKIAEQVATLQAPDDTELRDAKIKDALKSLAAALHVEIGDLSNIAMPMILKYLSDKLPEYKDFLNPANVSTLMSVAESEIGTVRAHGVVQMMHECLAYLQQVAPATAEAPATPPVASGNTDQPVQNHPEATEQPTTNNQQPTTVSAV